MTNGRKLIIALACAAALCLVGLGVFLGVRSYNNSVYTEKLSSGNRYYNAGDYANAVLAYQKAISINSNGTEAYAGLARTYSAQGFDNLAYEALQSGITETGSSQLRTMLAGMEDNVHVKSAGTQVELNTSLMRPISSMSYGDYTQIYSVEKISGTGDSVTVRVTEISADLVFRNSLSQPAAVRGGNVSADAVPEEIHLTNISLLFGGRTPISYDDLEQLRLDGLHLIPPQSGTDYYIVTFTNEGCEVSIETDESGEITAGAWNSIVPVNAIENSGKDDESREEKEDEGVPCTGKIVSALDGSPVADVRMRFYQSGGTESIEETVTDSTGNYTIGLPAGQYSVVLSRDGYIEEEQDLYIGAYAEEAFQDYTISPELASGQIRIVLSWGSTPADLDSHLVGTADNGYEMNVSFRNMSSAGPDGPLATLDIDKTSGYGPETTTIYDPNGKYYFRVHDYHETGFISQSGASVTVYLPGSSPLVFQLSDGILHDNDWDVFVLDHGVIKAAEDTTGWLHLGSGW